jgi:hypothetical protein
MLGEEKSFEQIIEEIDKKKGVLEEIRNTRNQAKWYLTQTSPLYEERKRKGIIAPGHRSFTLLAQGDSWFDYFGIDLIHQLNQNFGHKCSNIAVAGSTLNDEAYGPVPKDIFGIPQSDDISRIAELVHRIEDVKPQALLLSGGGNDVAGPVFFSFINNAASGLAPVNHDVVKGVLYETFKTCFEHLIVTALAAARKAAIKMPIFVHGYDYPWPDGRGVIDTPFWKVGPWFHESFNEKNFPLSDLQRRHDIVQEILRSLNQLLEELATKYKNEVFYVKLIGTLQGPADWGNELHPGATGFRQLAEKFDAELQKHL